MRTTIRVSRLVFFFFFFVYSSAGVLPLMLGLFFFPCFCTVEVTTRKGNSPTPFFPSFFFFFLPATDGPQSIHRWTLIFFFLPTGKKTRNSAGLRFFFFFPGPHMLASWDFSKELFFFPFPLPPSRRFQANRANPAVCFSSLFSFSFELQISSGHAGGGPVCAPLSPLTER